MKILPYGRQDIQPADIDAVNRVLESDFITQGPKVIEFENAIASYCGSNYAVAVNSATSALHLACLALGIGPGDHVWTSPITFVASANCARLCGAEVGFVDIDPTTYNLCPVALESKLLESLEQGRPLPKLLIVVHFAGQSCDMQAISQLAKKFDFRLVEDASHAIGGKYLDAPIGNCRYSDITVFSFHPVKIITTGEGGLATCNSADLYERMCLLRTHGVHKPTQGDITSEPWKYEQWELGLNYRLTDMQAALGLSQLRRLDSYVQRRHLLAQRYYELLAAFDVVIPYQAPFAYSSYHLYPILVGRPGDGGAGRRSLYHSMIEQGIGVNVHYIPVHTQPYYQQLGHRYGDFPNAEAYYERTMTLPLFGSMTDRDQDRVVGALYNHGSLQAAA